MALKPLRMLRKINQGLTPINTLPSWPPSREDRSTALSAESAHHVLGSPCCSLIKEDEYPDAHTRVLAQTDKPDTRETFCEKIRCLPNRCEPRGEGFG